MIDRRRYSFFALLGTLVLLGACSPADPTVDNAAAGSPPQSPACTALPAATEPTIEVDPSQTAQLANIVAQASSHTTVLLANGTYALNGEALWLQTPHVTLRSKSGNRDAVILDGGYQTQEVITIAASNIRIADLTIRRANTHPIHVVTQQGDTLNTLLYNLVIQDPGEQAIKINPSNPGEYVDNGVLACSHIILTDEGRPQVNTNAGGCYTGGVDAHQARGWVVRDNRIEGFWCPTGLAEHGVHCWRGCRDTVVERNVLLNNARGVGFGLESSGTARTFNDSPCPTVTDGYVGHYGGIIRNNFIYANSAALFASESGFDCGICLASACGAQCVHNTIVSMGDCFSSIEWRYTNSKELFIANNIASHALRPRENATADPRNNLTAVQPNLFVDCEKGDLHLAANATAAIDQGGAVPAQVCDDDIDAQPRQGPRDVGADER